MTISPFDSGQYYLEEIEGRAVSASIKDDLHKTQAKTEVVFGNSIKTNSTTVADFNNWESVKRAYQMGELPTELDEPGVLPPSGALELPNLFEDEEVLLNWSEPLVKISEASGAIFEKDQAVYIYPPKYHSTTPLAQDNLQLDKLKSHKKRKSCRDYSQFRKVKPEVRVELFNKYTGQNIRTQFDFSKIRRLPGAGPVK